MNFVIILNQISRGDEAAFRQVFEHFFSGLLSFCNSIVGDRQLAEEVVEDVFTKLWENRATLPAINHISYYLYRAVRYASLNARARENRYRRVSLDEVGDSFAFSYASCESSLISAENCRKISDAIGGLPPQCKLIFRLVKEEKMKYKEVALLLQLSEKTVENQINIATRKLIATLQETLPECRAYFHNHPQRLRVVV